MLIEILAVRSWEWKNVAADIYPYEGEMGIFLKPSER